MGLCVALWHGLDAYRAAQKRERRLAEWQFWHEELRRGASMLATLCFFRAWSQSLQTTLFPWNLPTSSLR